MSWVNFVTLNGDSLDPENVFGDLKDAEVTCCVARARLAKFLERPAMMVRIFEVDSDVEREVEDGEIIRLKVDRSLMSPMAGTNTSTSHLVMTTYRVVIVGMGRLFPEHYKAMQEMDTDEATEYWSMTILKQELFDVFLPCHMGDVCLTEIAVVLAACAPPQLLKVHLENILRRRWQIRSDLDGGPRHSDEVCSCAQSEAAACDHVGELVDNVLAYRSDDFNETGLSALCKHLAALSLFLHKSSTVERAQIRSLSALVQDYFVDLLDECMGEFSDRPRGIIYYNMHVCLFHQARACWAKRGWPFPRRSLHEHMTNHIQQLLQDPENDYWEADEFEDSSHGWGFALAYAKQHDDDHVQKVFPLDYTNKTVHDDSAGLGPSMSSTSNRSYPELAENDVEARLHMTWSGATMEVYSCPATLRKWFWHPESMFHCFEDELRNKGWERYIDGTGQHWWWNPATQDWFFERPGEDM